MPWVFALGSAVRTAMTPDANVFPTSMTEENKTGIVIAITDNCLCKWSDTHCRFFSVLDGKTLDFSWIDPVDAAKRLISRPKFSGKQ
jgi:hypothetical protein